MGFVRLRLEPGEKTFWVYYVSLYGPVTLFSKHRKAVDPGPAKHGLRVIGRGTITAKRTIASA